jgi:hypothetical protein
VQVEFTAQVAQRHVAHRLIGVRAVRAIGHGVSAGGSRQVLDAPDLLAANRGATARSFARTSGMSWAGARSRHKLWLRPWAGRRSGLRPVHHRHRAPWNPDASRSFAAGAGGSAAGAEHGQTVRHARSDSGGRPPACPPDAPAGCNPCRSNAALGRSGCTPALHAGSARTQATARWAWWAPARLVHLLQASALQPEPGHRAACSARRTGRAAWLAQYFSRTLGLHEWGATARITARHCGCRARSDTPCSSTALWCRPSRRWTPPTTLRPVANRLATRRGKYAQGRARRGAGGYPQYKTSSFKSRQRQRCLQPTRRPAGDLPEHATGAGCAPSMRSCKGPVVQVHRATVHPARRLPAPVGQFW